MFRQHKQRQSALSCAQHVRGRNERRKKTSRRTTKSQIRPWAVELLELLTMGIESIHSLRICSRFFYSSFQFVSSSYLLCHIKMQINVLTPMNMMEVHKTYEPSIEEWNKDFIWDVVLLRTGARYLKCQVQIHNRCDENIPTRDTKKHWSSMQPANWIRGEHQ